VQLADDWTPEQTAAFREAWDQADKDKLRWLPPGAVVTPRPQAIVLHFWWTEGSTARQETYGPWPVAGEDGDAHLEQIVSFLRDWKRVTGLEPDTVTMALVMDPAAWLAERQQ
jgi:hypothetical protein